MTPDLDFDPALFGAYVPAVPVYDGLRARERFEDPDAGLAAEAGRVILELKAEAQLSSGDELSAMLSVMTRELREQLQSFQRMRQAAEAGMAAALADGGETDRKQQQADAKASIEAMSVIVRTLEKIDSLQRTLAQDRERQAEATLDEEAYAALVKSFEKRIDDRANDRAKTLLERWKREHLAALAETGGVEAGTGPPGPG